jgi:type III restriction enzyme
MTARRSLIINSPYEAPRFHWQQGSGTDLRLIEGRRPASYEVIDTRNNTRRVESLEQVNRIRERVDVWRSAGYPGLTSVSRTLLEHWRDQSARDLPFYFCQLEAIETLIWRVEAAAEHRQGIHVPGDGGAWERLCNKMATGSGKTAVMGMIITWQVLNAQTYPKRAKDFSRAVFVVAPGLTVRERLQVLLPGNPANVYDEFRLCPSDALRQRLNQAEVLIENWHTLMPLRQAERSVVKKGAESDKAFVRRVLGKLSSYREIVVINDEAHHAYRQSADDKRSRDVKRRAEEMGLDPEEATRWIEGLDRIHKELRIQRCFDLSATPFAPTGRGNSDEGLFDWIVSDFGLNDAIEAGLVKTPRVVVRDDALPNARDLKPKLYHLYREPEVQEDLNRRGAQPTDQLPELVKQAYTLLGADWRATTQQWAEAGQRVPPVLLTVCNRTETAARIESYFNRGDAHWPELHAPGRTLRVDSRVLDKAEIGESSGTDKQYDARLHEIVDAADLPPDLAEELRGRPKEELLREIVDNVGKRGRAGQRLQNVISVAMLSEGWDAKNVTHILGLRAFTSQLLCEQVIGRGLRRVSFETEAVVGSDGVERQLFRPEYVNIFGVPLSIFQDVDGDGEAPPPPKPSTQVESLLDRNALEIRWPNVLRVDPVVRPELAVRWAEVEVLKLSPEQTPISADFAPALGGVTDWSRIHSVDLTQLAEEFRLQRLLFQAAQRVHDQMAPSFSGGREWLLAQLVRLVEQFLGSDRLVVPSLFHSEPVRRRVLVCLNLDRIVTHLLRFVYEHNSERMELIFDEAQPIGTTRAMRTWYTTRPVMPTVKSQVSHVVGDSAWEGHVVNVLERMPEVAAYVKNDHLGYQIHYLWKGSRRRFVPDFLVRMQDGLTLVLEVKGVDDDQNRAKRAALAAWVTGVNQRGGFGRWAGDVVFEPAATEDVLRRHVGASSL